MGFFDRVALDAGAPRETLPDRTRLQTHAGVLKLAGFDLGATHASTAPNWSGVVVDELASVGTAVPMPEREAVSAPAPEREGLDAADERESAGVHAPVSAAVAGPARAAEPAHQPPPLEQTSGWAGAAHTPETPPLLPELAEPTTAVEAAPAPGRVLLASGGARDESPAAGSVSSVRAPRGFSPVVVEHEESSAELHREAPPMEVVSSMEAPRHGVRLPASDRSAIADGPASRRSSAPSSNELSAIDAPTHLPRSAPTRARAQVESTLPGRAVQRSVASGSSSSNAPPGSVTAPDSAAFLQASGPSPLLATGTRPSAPASSSAPGNVAVPPSREPAESATVNVPAPPTRAARRPNVPDEADPADAGTFARALAPGVAPSRGLAPTRGEARETPRPATPTRPMPAPSPPKLVIGRLDVIVEAPVSPERPAPSPAPAFPDASSALYLRRL